MTKMIKKPLNREAEDELPVTLSGMLGHRHEMKERKSELNRELEFIRACERELELKAMAEILAKFTQNQIVDDKMLKVNWESIERFYRRRDTDGDF